MILKLPMCPTSNHMYASVRGRLIKSAEARKYKQAIDILKLKYHKKIDEFKRETNLDTILIVDLAFVFPKKKFFCKDGSLRKFDYSNRHKIAFDAVSDLIDIDDSKFICGLSLKSYWDKDEEAIFANIKLLDRIPEFNELGYE